MRNRFKEAFDAKKPGELMSDALARWDKENAPEKVPPVKKVAPVKKAAAKKAAPKKAAAKTSSVKTATNGKNRATENISKGKATKKGKP